MEPRDAGGEGITTTPPIATPPVRFISKPPVPKGVFPGLEKELNDELVVERVDITKPENGHGPEYRGLLKTKDAKKQFLPGQPRVKLDSLYQHENPDQNDLLEYLRRDHLTDPLDELLPYMRYIFVQTPSFRHIMPLHHQQAHAREIMVNEKPGLHLVWYYERIFIKPIPAYFYSQAFWDYLKQADDKVYRASVGFMRTYYYLIQYQIDFEEGCRRHLIPRKSDGHYPTYEEFCDFILPFTKVDDDHVSRRFHYGELRLTRINRTAFLFKRQLAYFHIFPQWGSFLSHILAPVVTVFAVFSVVLNSMQVGLAALGMGQVSDDHGWPRFVSVSLYFPVVIMLSIALVLAAIFLGIAAMGVKDLIHGNNVRRRKKRGDPFAGEKSHGMI